MRRIALLISASLTLGCATLADTPAQTRTYTAWKQCEGIFPGVKLARVSPDGSGVFAAGSPAARAAVQECMARNPR